jgi:hypothetical protein
VAGECGGRLDEIHVREDSRGGGDSGIVIFPAEVELVVLEDLGVPEGVELLGRW